MDPYPVLKSGPGFSTSTAVWARRALSVELRGSGAPEKTLRQSSMMRAQTPQVVGAAIEVPQKTVYPPPWLHEVTPVSSLDWHPGAEMSGRMRSSSVGPQLEKLVIESS